MIKPVTNYPSTIPAAVDAVLDDLPRETLDQIASVGRDELIKMHLIVGSHLRNTLGLWAGNPDLLNACGKPHPNRCRGSTAEDSIWRSNRSWIAGETLNMVRLLFSSIIQKNVIPEGSISSKGARQVLKWNYVLRLTLTVSTPVTWTMGILNVATRPASASVDGPARYLPDNDGTKRPL